jgi:hypothetical protein
MVARISIVLPKAIHAKVKVHSLVYSSGLDNTFSLHKRRRKVCACAHPQPFLHLLDSPHRASGDVWIRVSRSHVQNRNRMTASSHADPFERAALRVLDADHAILGAVKRRRAA